jgi:hypothetical protein
MVHAILSTQAYPFIHCEGVQVWEGPFKETKVEMVEMTLRGYQEVISIGFSL